MRIFHSFNQARSGKLIASADCMRPNELCENISILLFLQCYKEEFLLSKDYKHVVVISSVSINVKEEGIGRFSSFRRHSSFRRKCRLLFQNNHYRNLGQQLLPIRIEDREKFFKTVFKSFKYLNYFKYLRTHIRMHTRTYIQINIQKSIQYLKYHKYFKCFKFFDCFCQLSCLHTTYLISVGKSMTYSRTYSRTDIKNHFF